MADNDQPKDSLATRISKQFDQMIRSKAAQKGKELDAQRQQQEQQKQTLQQQPQPQEKRSTIEQIRQDRQAPEQVLKDID